MSGTHLVAGERIPYEASPASIPQRQVAGDTFPQRHVAGENPDMSPGKRAIVVVIADSKTQASSSKYGWKQDTRWSELKQVARGRGISY
ncbi:hypothetical protein Tco_1358092 [Tanacetum coccineum]